MKRSPAVRLAAALGAAAFPAFAWAQTVVVECSGESSAIERAAAGAGDGDTLVVKPGVYRGPLEIKKPLKLVADGRAVIDGRGTGTVVRLEAPNIEFRGFTVRSSGDVLGTDDAGILASGLGIVIEDNRVEDVLFGVYLKQSSESVVRNNTLVGKNLDLGRRGDLIRVWYSHDVVLQGNNAFDGRDVVLWYSRSAHLTGNRFARGRYGIHFMYCNNSVVEDNNLSDNSVGVYLMYSARIHLRGNKIIHNRGPSGFGIGFKDMENPRIEGNLVCDNRVGVFMDACRQGIFTGNTIASNDVGFELSPAVQGNSFEKNNVIDNTEQVKMDRSSSATVNHWRENFWADYRGYDADKNGVGDIPYRSVRLYENITDRFRSLKIFTASPAVFAVDFAAGVFPVFAPSPKFSDERPLMGPVSLRVRPDEPRGSGWWLAVAASLLLPVIRIWTRFSA